jgi:toxin-antitoxin system PIN domain toxin
LASLFDTNLWLALTFPKHQLRERALEYLVAATEDDPAAFCVATRNSWLRLATTPTLHRAYEFATITNRDALTLWEKWIAKPYVTFIEIDPPGAQSLALLLADLPTASPKRWMDAYLAAFAISGNLRFVTADKDFRQFESAGLDLHLLTT